MQNLPAGAGEAAWDWIETFEGGVTVAKPAADGMETGGGWIVVPAAWDSGSLIPWRMFSVMSLDARRNSVSAFPMLRPISGSFLGPKTSTAITMMNRMWMGWISNGKGWILSPWDGRCEPALGEGWCSPAME